MLFKKLKTDRIIAFKARDTKKSQLLGLFISEASLTIKEPGDEVVKKVLTSAIKNANLCSDSYTVEIAESYLPKKLSVEELTKLIITLIAEHKFSITEMGKFMKLIRTYEGVDMKLASSIFKEQF